MRPAVFMDRDGTLIEQVHHLTSVDDVRLVPGVPGALHRLREAGYALVVVTNQSVVGRGLLTIDGLDRIHDEMVQQIRAGGGPALDGIYFCPHVPRTDDPSVIERIDRKPGPGMLERAARELDIDIAGSWMVGDAPSDILAGRNAGCRDAILVRTGYGSRHARTLDREQHVVDDMNAAADLIARHAFIPETPSEERGRRR